MKFASVESAIRALYRDLEAGRAPKTQALGHELNLPGDRCANTKCRFGGAPVAMSAKGGGTVPKCPKCSTVWPHDRAYIPNGLFAQGGGGRPPRALVKAQEAAAWFAQLRGDLDCELWLQWFLAPASRHVTRERMVEDLNRAAPPGSEPWTVHKLRTRQERGYRLIELELRHAGMIEEGGDAWNETP